jgi:putative peptidoglycan lipid II flippase
VTAASTTSRGAPPSVLRSTGVMAIGTIASRGTGFLRTLVLLAALGSAQLGDAYNIPNTVPNAIYDLLLGGVLTSVVVPLLVKAARDDGDGGVAYAQRLLTIVAVVLGACTIVAVIAAPWIVDLYAGRFTQPQHQLAVVFARYFLPQILFYGLSATIGAILNVRGRFAAPMWAPVLNNVVVIGVGLAFISISSRSSSVALTSGQRTLLGVGTTAGVVLQTVALWPSLRAAGFRYRPRFDWRGVGLGQAGRLAGWVLVYVAVNQVGLVVITNLGGASERTAVEHHLTSGVSYTAYLSAYQLFQLPYAIVAVSVITALLPRMSAHAVDGNLAGVRADLSAGLRTTAAAVVPAVAGMLALAPQIAIVALRHRQITPSDARYIGYVLMAFALGLVPFAAFQLQLRAFYALRDTRTPALINIVATAVNIGADIALYELLQPRWRVVGLALGFGASYWVALVLTSRALGRRIDGLDGYRVVRTYIRLVVASAIAGGLALAVARVIVRELGDGFTGSLVALALGTGIGVLMLLGLAHRMRIGELTQLVGAIRGRLG